MTKLAITIFVINLVATFREISSFRDCCSLRDFQLHTKLHTLLLILIRFPLSSVALVEEFNKFIQIEMFRLRMIVCVSFEVSTVG